MGKYELYGPKSRSPGHCTKAEIIAPSAPLPDASSYFAVKMMPAPFGPMLVKYASGRRDEYGLSLTDRESVVPGTCSSRTGVLRQRVAAKHCNSAMLSCHISCSRCLWPWRTLLAISRGRFISMPTQIHSRSAKMQTDPYRPKNYQGAHFAP